MLKMTVVCICNTSPFNDKPLSLEIGKQYVIEQTIDYSYRADNSSRFPTLYKVMNSRGELCNYSSKLFISVEEYREQKLKMLLDV